MDVDERLSLIETRLAALETKDAVTEVMLKAIEGKLDKLDKNITLGVRTVVFSVLAAVISTVLAGGVPIGG